LSKRKSVTVKHLRSWREIAKYEKHGWLYRGQREAKWFLKTSLERTCDRLHVAKNLRPEAEERLLREFKRAYHQYAPHIPKEDAILEWFSIMQHYGAPTRLLDFTYSIYVAAYFAVENAEGDSAIWGLHAPWAHNASVERFRNKGKQETLLAPLERAVNEADDRLVHLAYMEKPYVAAALTGNPFRLNERLRIQQGAFVIPGDITNTFMANVLALPDADDPQRMVKIIIPKSIRLQAIRSLWSMGISRASLFPGIDGYAESLGVYHSLFFPTPYGSYSTSLIKASRRQP
jgi:hypothetical protein